MVKHFFLKNNKYLNTDLIPRCPLHLGAHWVFGMQLNEFFDRIVDYHITLISIAENRKHNYDLRVLNNFRQDGLLMDLFSALLYLSFISLIVFVDEIKFQTVHHTIASIFIFWFTPTDLTLPEVYLAPFHGLASLMRLLDFHPNLSYKSDWKLNIHIWI